MKGKDSFSYLYAINVVSVGYMGYVNPNYPVHVTVGQLLAYGGNCPYSNAVVPYDVYPGYAVYIGNFTKEQITASPKNGFEGRLFVRAGEYSEYSDPIKTWDYQIGQNFSAGSSSVTFIGSVSQDFGTILEIGRYIPHGKTAELTLVPFAKKE